MSSALNTRVPASEAAIECGLSRESLIRRIQSRAVRGAYQAGKWYVDRDEVARLAGERAGSGAAA